MKVRHYSAILVVVAMCVLIAIAKEEPKPSQLICAADPRKHPGVIQGSELLGFIRCFVPPTEAYNLTRAGKHLPLGWGVTVQGGDILELARATQPSDSAFLLVVEFGDVEITIDHDHPRLQIPQPSQPPSDVQLAFAHVMEFLSGFVPKPDPDSDRPAIEFKIQGSGSAISIPLLERAPGQLIAAKRMAYLPWIGGTPPYRFSIYSKRADDPVVTISDIKTARVTFDESKLSPGNYHVVVEDAREVSSGGSLRVLLPDALPSLRVADSKALQQGEASEPLKVTLLASWMSEQKGGSWALEAYQLIAIAPEDFPPGMLLRRRLEGRQ